MTPTREIRRLIIFGVVATATMALLLWLLYSIRGTLLLVYVSALFAIGIAPLVDWLERRRLIPMRTTRVPRPLAILIIYAGIVAAVVVMGMAIAQPLVQQAEELWRVLPDRLNDAQAWLVRLGVIKETITLGQAMQNAPVTGGANAVGTVLLALYGFVGGLFGLITILLLTFYLLVEAQSIFSTFVRLFPRAHRQRVADISGKATTKVSAWLGGQIVLSLIIGLTSALGLFALGVPYFYVLALLAAIGELIPMVGPIVAAVPAIIVALSVSPGLAAGVTIFFVIQQQVENAILVPRIMGRQVGISAVTVIVALGIGTELLGLVGAILAIPTAAIVQTLFEELRTEDH